MNKFHRLSPLLKNFVENGPAGCACSVTHHRELLYENYVGYADLEEKKPITSDTIYRIYSMTKVVTCVAALILYERGLYLLNDPLEEYLPEFKNPEVYASSSKTGFHTMPASRSIQVKDLFRMTSGLTYQGDDTHVERQVSKVMADLKRQDSDTNRLDVRALSKALATIPLAFDPGSEWKYSLSHDVLGAFIEVLSGKSFGQFLKEEIFDPLEMHDTSFHISDEKKERLCSLYNRSGDGKLEKNNSMDTNFWPNSIFESGGGGLLSTLGDYSRFAHMLANGGELNGVRILGLKTIQLMATNHLDYHLLSSLGWNYNMGYGYGLGVRVMVDNTYGGSNSSIGEFGWSGMAGTWVMIDPKEKLSAVYMQQMLPNFEAYHQPRLRNAIYGAL